MMNRQTTPSIDDRILIVDDDENDRELLAAGLRAQGYPCEVASDGLSALDRLSTKSFSLMLADVRMPRLDGLKLLQIAQVSHSDLIVIITTASNDRDTAVNALRQGAYDFIVKPFSLEEVTFSIRRALEQRRLSTELRVYRQALERKVADRTRDLQNLHEELTGMVGGIVQSFALALETRDPYLAQHSQRVAALSLALGTRLGLKERRMEILQQAALLHDIGKIGISESVLHKGDTLTDEERKQIKSHPLLAERILSPIKQFEPIILPIRHQYESYDGSGTPAGLAGEEIPLESRIIAVADAYDLLASKRPNRHALSHATAMQILHNGAGRIWDPRVVTLLEQLLENNESLAVPVLSAAR
jgi:putative two-component system response regulator